MHFPVGCVAAWLSLAEPTVGVPFTSAWLVYEIIEDWRIADRSYLDVAGFLWGYGVTGALLVVLTR